MSIRAALSPADFTDSIERSFLFFLQNNLPSVTVAGDVIPVDIVNCMPYEWYVKQRGGKIVVDVAQSNMQTKGYSIGNSIVSNSVPVGVDSITAPVVPWQYLLSYTINVYSGSGAERSKVDGRLLELFEELRRGIKDCPVYQWATDTSSATAYSTGSNLVMVGDESKSFTHSEDFDNADYLSHVALDLRCLYVRDTESVPVTAFDLTSTINA